jgi:hypothetical protein
LVGDLYVTRRSQGRFGQIAKSALCTIKHSQWTSRVCDARALPSELAPYPNNPRPFNPSTTIGFALPKSAFVTLRVYDLLGRLVGELVNEKLGPGTYKTQWDARGLASGVYFYRLTAGEYVETKRLLLLC